MMKFAFIYALPGYQKEEFHTVNTNDSTFYAVAVDYAHREKTSEIAIKLVNEYDVDMIELCGGLANAELMADVKRAVNNKVPVGAVYYGPESRQPLADLVKKL